MLLSNRRYQTFFSLTLLVIWLWVFLDRPYSFPTHQAWNIYSNTPLSSPVLDVFTTFPLSSQPLRQLCAAVPPSEEDVIFTCDESFGSPTAVRNSILNCVRLAIAAGGSLVMPKIIVREERTGDPISSNTTSMEYLFDTKHFVQSLKSSCPQLKVYESVRHIPNPSAARGPVVLQPESMVRDHPNASADEWRGFFDSWLLSKIPKKVGEVEGKEGSSIIVELGRAYLQYPIYADGSEIANTFGRMLNFNEEIRTLATKVLMKMAERYELDQDLENRILKGAFLGAVLSIKGKEVERGMEVDGVTGSWDGQKRIYLSQAIHANISLIYAVSDEVENFHYFVEDATAKDISVTSKSLLLKPGDLQALTEDQQAAVDFLVLLKSGQFAGAGHDGLSWNVALSRHRFAVMKNHLDGPLMMNDELSRIYGAVGGNSQFAACMWP